MVAHAYDTINWESEAGVWIWDQPQVLSEILSLKTKTCRAVVSHAFNPSAWEAEAGRSLFEFRGQPGLQSSRTARATQKNLVLKAHLTNQPPTHPPNSTGRQMSGTERSKQASNRWAVDSFLLGWNHLQTPLEHVCFSQNSFNKEKKD